MSDDWLTQLEQLHNADKSKQQAEAEKQTQQEKQTKQERAIVLLNDSKAHELLRQVQKVLLDGKGTLDVFEEKGKYDRAIVLAWQGPVSNAHRPNPKDPADYQYILVGVHQNELWVNGKSVKEATPEALQIELLEAAKNPGIQKRKASKKK